MKSLSHITQTESDPMFLEPPAHAPPPIPSTPPWPGVIAGSMGALPQVGQSQLAMPTYEFLPHITQTESDLMFLEPPAHAPPPIPSTPPWPGVICEPSILHSNEELPELGTLWKCIASKPNPAGGKLFIFKLNPRFHPDPEKRSDAEKLEIKNLFPAAEPEDFDNICGILDSFDSQNEMEGFLFLHRLGYDIQKPDIFILPDHDALISNWRHLQEEHHEKTPESPLPNLTIISSEDIVNDQEFVQAYIVHAGLLSSGKEFVHDHFFHIVPLLLGMSNSSWVEARAQAVELAQTAQKKVIQAKAQLESLRGHSNEIDNKINLRIRQLDTILGLFIDTGLAAAQLPLNEVSQAVLSDMPSFLETLMLTDQVKDFWSHLPYPPLTTEERTKIINLFELPTSGDSHEAVLGTLPEVLD